MYRTSWGLEELSDIVLHCEGSAPLYGVNVPQNYIFGDADPGPPGVKWPHYRVKLRKRLRRGGALDVCAHVLNETALRCLMLVCRPGIRHGMMQDRPEAEAG